MIAAASAQLAATSNVTMSLAMCRSMVAMARS
jgi:hypothetical protein